jgi:hypothetical protein
MDNVDRLIEFMEGKTPEEVDAILGALTRTAVTDAEQAKQVSSMEQERKARVDENSLEDLTARLQRELNAPHIDMGKVHQLRQEHGQLLNKVATARQPAPVQVDSGKIDELCKQLQATPLNNRLERRRLNEAINAARIGR